MKLIQEWSVLNTFYLVLLILAILQRCFRIETWVGTSIFYVTVWAQTWKLNFEQMGGGKNVWGLKNLYEVLGKIINFS